METHAHPFAFLMLPFALGFFSSFIFGLLVRACFPTREIEKALG